MFNKAVITAKGLALDAKVSAGQTNAVFTAIKLGNGSYSDTEDLSAVTAIKSIKQTFGISSIAVIENNTVRLRSVIDNLGVEEGYYISEVGIYAQDPDYGEILYSIATGVKNKMDYQPSETELEGATSTFDTYTTISNSVNASISMGTGAMASAEDVEELRNGKVDTTGGDISETVIETLDTVEDKYPIPAAGESVKRFFGKALTFLRNIRPLTGDINIYVSTTGSDITGDGDESNPYASIGKALGTITKDLGGYTAAINISDGTYNEDVVIKGISNGYIRLQRNGVQELNNLCNVKSIRVENCNSVSISGLNLTTTDTSGIFGTRTDFINVQSCQSISNANTQPSFNFDYVSVVRVAGNRSLNHYSCLRSYFSEVSSEKWSSDSVGIQCGIDVSSGGKVTRGDTYQPRGNVIDVYYAAGGIVVNQYGANVGCLPNDVNLYVSTMGSDITGKGTSENPFKTIQHAIDILPKDLNGRIADIQVANGTYLESIVISGYYNGYLNIASPKPNQLSTDVSLSGKISIIHCDSHINIRGINIADTSNTAAFEATFSNYIYLHYVNIVGVALDKTGIYGGSCNQLKLYYCRISNRNRAVDFVDTSGYIWGCSGNGNNVGSVSGGASVMHMGSNNSMSSITNRIQYSGGQFIEENGTQISGPYTSGLSCTWGTLSSGGYVRHGNLNGVAMVTINIRVTLTTSLTTGGTYYIYGFPGYNNGDHVPVTTNVPATTSWCYLNSTGTLLFAPARNFSSGEVIMFSATYLTNS